MTNAAYLIKEDLSSHPAPCVLQRKDHLVHLITAPNLVLRMQLAPKPLHTQMVESCLVVDAA
jgi:hypothetical protein